ALRQDARLHVEPRPPPDRLRRAGPAHRAGQLTPARPPVLAWGMALPPVPPALLPPEALGEELRRLPEVAEEADAAAATPTLQEHSAAFVKQVARVGKQQMKTAQEVSLLSSEVQALGEALRQAMRDKEEVIDLLRRERDGLAGQNDVLLRELVGLT